MYGDRVEIFGVVPHIHPRRPSVEAQGALVAAFTAARMAIRRTFAPGEPVTLAFAAAARDTGTSFVAANLALNFAEAGYRVMLVDGDTQQGMVHRAFGTAMSPGLLDVARGTRSMDALVHYTAYERLLVIPRGSGTGTEAARLTTAMLHDVRAELMARFDVVIVDTASVTGEEQTVAALANRVVVVAPSDDEALSQAKATVSAALPVGCSLLGAVLINAR